jgi:hypothetical protein
MKHSYTLKSVLHPVFRAFLALPVDLKWARVLSYYCISFFTGQLGSRAGRTKNEMEIRKFCTVCVLVPFGWFTHHLPGGPVLTLGPTRIDTYLPTYLPTCKEMRIFKIGKY